MAIDMTSTPRYDPDENISRHGASDPEQCEKMAKRQSILDFRFEILD